MKSDKIHSKFIAEIIKLLRSKAKSERIEYAKTSFPTKMEVIGVESKDEKEVLKFIKAETKKWSPKEKIQLAVELVNTNIFEAHHIGFEFLGRDKKSMKHIESKDVDAMDHLLDNWVSIDCFSGYIAGVAWREGIISDSKILSYFESEDHWRRRIPIVSTVALNQKARGGDGDPEKTLMICKKATKDHQDKINKALSWALRELAKRDAEPVKKFLNDHQEELHPRVLREVKNKLNKGKKN